MYYKYLDPNLFIYEWQSAELLNEWWRVPKKAWSTSQVALDKDNGWNQQSRERGSIPKNDDANTQVLNGEKNARWGTADNWVWS